MAVVMAWSQCKIEIGATGESDAMATSLTEVARVKEDSTSLESDLGTALEAYASGHKLIGQEYPQETLKLNTTIIEPDDALLTLLGIGTTSEGATGETTITSHVVQKFFSLVVTPKHKGAKGIKAPKCKVTYTPAYGETTGNEATLAFEITKTTEATDNYWYKRFTTASELA